MNPNTPQSLDSILAPLKQPAVAQRPSLDEIFKGVPKLSGQDINNLFPSPAESAVQNTAKDYANALPNLINEAGRNDQSTSQNPIVRTGENFLGSAVSAIGTVFSPITNAVKSVSDSFARGAKDPMNPSKPLYDNPVIGKILDLFSGANGKLDEFAQAHPEAARNLSNLLTVGLTAAGGESGIADKPIGSIEGIKNGISDISDAASKKAGDIKASKNAASNDKSVKKSIDSTMPFQSKDVRIDDLRGSLPDSSSGKGGVNREGVLGKSKSQPSTDDIERGTIAHEYIKDEKDPLKQIQNVNKGIIDSSSKLDSFLDEKSTPANFENMRKYVEQNNVPDKNLQKDPAAFESYTRANENALQTLYETMKGNAKESGDFSSNTSGSDIRAARQLVDQQITKELGEEAFGTPQYKGIKAAEISVRNTLNRMSEDMLRYPGQMEKLNKMSEFINSAKQRGIEVDINNPEVKESLEKQFGLNRTPESESNAQKLSDEHSRMSRLYEARDNMIDKYQKNVGKNKVQEFVKNHPKTTKVAKYAATAVAGGEVVKHLLP